MLRLAAGKLVMKSLSVSELDLLSFFEVEPKRGDLKCDPEGPWQYDNSTYEVTQGTLQLSFGLTPHCADVSVQLRLNGVILCDLHFAELDDIRYSQEKGRENLELILRTGNSIWLQLKPQISIQQF